MATKLQNRLFRENNLDYHKNWVKAHPEFKEYQKEYQKQYQKIHWKKYSGKYSKNLKYKEKAIRRAKLYNQRNPEKYKARYTLRNAVVLGKVIKPNVCFCGNIKPQAHHPDYSKPLDVMWLCRECHVDIHRKNLV